MLINMREIIKVNLLQKLTYVDTFSANWPYAKPRPHQLQLLRLSFVPARHTQFAVITVKDFTLRILCVFEQWGLDFWQVDKSRFLISVRWRLR